MKNEYYLELYLLAGKLKNGHIRGSEEWKEFTAIKKELRRKIWHILINLPKENEH